MRQSASLASCATTARPRSSAPIIISVLLLPLLTGSSRGEAGEEASASILHHTWVSCTRSAASWLARSMAWVQRILLVGLTADVGSEGGRRRAGRRRETRGCAGAWGSRRGSSRSATLDHRCNSGSVGEDCAAAARWHLVEMLSRRALLRASFRRPLC